MTPEVAADVAVAIGVVENLRWLLVQRRHELGLSQMKAARAIGISQTTIEHIEQGRGVRTDTALLVLMWIIEEQS